MIYREQQWYLENLVFDLGYCPSALFIYSKIMPTECDENDSDALNIELTEEKHQNMKKIMIDSSNAIHELRNERSNSIYRIFKQKDKRPRIEKNLHLPSKSPPQPTLIFVSDWLKHGPSIAEVARVGTPTIGTPLGADLLEVDFPLAVFSAAEERVGQYCVGRINEPGLSNLVLHHLRVVA
jgi:hypothetical protein